MTTIDPTCETCRRYTVTIGPVIHLGRVKRAYSVGRCGLDRAAKMSTDGCERHQSKPPSPLPLAPS